MYKETGNIMSGYAGKKKNGKYTLWSPPKKVTVKVNTPKPAEVEGITVNGSTVQ